MLTIDAVVMLILIALDQLTKHLAVIHLKGSPAVSLIDGVLALKYLENRGSAFGILQDRKIFILFVGVIFMAVCLFWSTEGKILKSVHFIWSEHKRNCSGWYK